MVASQVNGRAAVLRFEGETPEALARIQDEFRSVILAAKPDAKLPF